MEVRELLSQVGLNTSGHASGNSTPKRLEPVVLVTPLPTEPEVFPWPVDTSYQVSTPDDTEMEDVSLEEILTVSSPTAKTPGPSSDAPIGHSPSPGRGQQGPGRNASDWVLHQCPSAEISLGAWHGSSSEQFQNCRIYQGSKDCLCLSYPGSQDPLLHIHQGGRGLGSLPGWITSTMTC